MLLTAALGAMTTAQAQTYTILYSFKGAPIPDAASPQGDLIRDAKGNLYGTTALAEPAAQEQYSSWTRSATRAFDA
jgi:hypothetical protein